MTTSYICNLPQTWQLLLLLASRTCGAQVFGIWCICERRFAANFETFETVEAEIGKNGNNQPLYNFTNEKGLAYTRQQYKKQYIFLLRYYFCSLQSLFPDEIFSRCEQKLTRTSSEKLTLLPAEWRLPESSSRWKMCF